MSTLLIPSLTVMEAGINQVNFGASSGLGESKVLMWHCVMQHNLTRSRSSHATPSCSEKHVVYGNNNYWEKVEIFTKVNLSNRHLESVSDASCLGRRGGKSLMCAGVIGIVLVESELWRTEGHARVSQDTQKRVLGEAKGEQVVFGWCTAHWPQACGRREVAVAPDAIAGLRPAELITALAHVAHWVSVSLSSWLWEELQKGYNFWVTSGCKTTPAAAVVLASISDGSSAANPALLPSPKRATMLPRCARSSLPAGDDGWGCVWDMAWQWPLPQIWLGCWWRAQRWG